MIEIPLPEIIEKIKAQKGLSDADIRKRIKEKLTQLAGLISEEGAAHIVANELGIELVKQGEMKIRDLYAGMRNITVAGKVTRKYELRTFTKDTRTGQVASFLIGDETGQVRVTLWNDQTADFDRLSDGDIIRVKNGYVKENRGAVELHLNADSRLEIRPSGVTVADVRAAPKRDFEARAPAERKTIKELTGDEENVELLATVVQLYEPRYFDVCPQCNKRVLQTGDGAKCAEHGIVTPQTNYVLSAFLDDGTGNMRATFWKQQSQRLTGKSDGEFLQYKENPSSFEAVKTDLLGEIIKVVGRCKKNETFDRIELTANLVFKDIDPEEELTRLKNESLSTATKIDAPLQVKEKIVKAIETPKSAKPVVKIEEEIFAADVDTKDFGVDDELSGAATEDAISLDELEDLDEKL